MKTPKIRNIRSSVLAAVLLGTAGSLSAALPVFNEDFNDNDISDWTAGSENLDGADVSVNAVASGGAVQLQAIASCFSDPFDGLGSTLTKTISLPNGTYIISYDVSQITTFYAFCETSATGESGIVVNGVPISPISCTQAGDCGTCNVPTTTVTGCFTVTGGSAELKLRTFATDCGDSTGVFDNITISAAPNKCPISLGNWKTHPETWPVTTLTLGTVSYTQAQLLAILNTSPGTGTKSDASVLLAYQLIVAKLNIANGANPCPFAATIAAADALIDGRTIPITPKITPDTAEGKQMINLANTLAPLNNPTPGCTR